MDRKRPFEGRLRPRKRRLAANKRQASQPFANATLDDNEQDGFQHPEDTPLDDPDEPQASQPFEYTALDNDAIRILRLLPARHKSDPLVGELRHASLSDQNLKYTALSYAWGDSTPTQSIIINGKPLGIAKNLDSAFRHLRLLEARRTLWVDAICINQSDDQEKGPQVRHMHEIYKHAHLVVSWIGEETENIAGAFEALEKTSRVINQYGKSLNNSEKREVQKLMLEPDIRIPIVALTQRPYWRRLWIVPEILNAKNTLVQYGNCTMEMKFLFDTVRDMLFHISRAVFSKAGYLLYFIYVIQSLHDRAATKRNSPLDYLWTLRTFSVSDPRDRIFALLGVPCTENRVDLSLIDYSLSIDEIHEQFARSWISATGSLDILGYAHAEECRCEVDNSGDAFLYSERGTWVPTWQRMRNRDVSPLSRHRFPSPLYNASNESSHLGSSLTANHALACSGFFYDRVKDVGPSCKFLTPFPEPTDTALMAWEDMMLGPGGHQHRYGHSHTLDDLETDCAESSEIQDAVNTVMRLLNARSEQLGLVEAFWRTLIVDRYCQSGSWTTGRAGRDQWVLYSQWREGRGNTDGVQERWYQRLFLTCKGRKFVITESGYIGLASHLTRPGDQICILRGGQVPYIVRVLPQTEDESTRMFIGECYVHGIMDGEACEGRDIKDDETIILR